MTRRGRITRCGNRIVRTALIESAWNNRFVPALRMKRMRHSHGPRHLREVELPVGFEIGKHVDDEEIRGAAIVATRRTKRVVQALRDEFLFELRPDVVPPKQYGAFLALARRIDETFLASVVLAPGLPAPTTKAIALSGKSMRFPWKVHRPSRSHP
jgi:hypothetical protein